MAQTFLTGGQVLDGSIALADLSPSVQQMLATGQGGGWNWAQATFDANTQPLSLMLPRITPSNPDYDQPFAIMRSVLISVGAAQERITNVQLHPALSGPTWTAAANYPAGSISASSTALGCDAYKLLDTGAGTFWQANGSTGSGIGQYVQIHWDSPVIITGIDVLSAAHGWTAKQLTVSSGSTASLTPRGAYTVEQSAAWQSFTLPAAAPATELRIAVTENWGNRAAVSEIRVWGVAV